MAAVVAAVGAGVSDGGVGIRMLETTLSCGASTIGEAVVAITFSFASRSDSTVAITFPSASRSDSTGPEVTSEGSFDGGIGRVKR